MCTCLVNEQGVKISTVEHLLSAVAGLGIDNLIIESLQSILEFSGGDRCYIYMFAENNRQLNLTHEYSRDHVSPKIPRHERIDHDDFAWLVKPLLDNKPVSISSVDRYPRWTHSIRNAVVTPAEIVSNPYSSQYQLCSITK